MRLVKLVGLGAALVILAVAASKIGPVGLAQANCTVTVKPGESIQKAIDSVQEGAVICLATGTWEENITVRKSLTLRGAGQEYTSIKSKPFPIIQLTQPPVILIQSSVEKSVLVEGLNISGARLDVGVRVQGRARATFSHVRIFDNRFGDLVAEGSSEMIIINAYLSHISVRDSSRANLSNVEVYQGFVDVRGSASLVITNSRILLGVGLPSLQATASAQVSIVGSTISGGSISVLIKDFASVRISNSQVSNGVNGVRVEDMADLDIRDSRIVGHAGCGIWVLSPTARASGTPNEMRDNGADLCGYAPVGIRKPLVPETQKLQLSVPDDYKTIQEAIDAIAPGGTVTVAPGSYRGGVTIWKPLTLQGSGAESTEITSPQASHRVLMSILAEVKKEVEIAKLSITRSWGFTVWVFGQSVVFRQVRISNNEHALYVGGTAQVQLIDSEIQNNKVHGITLDGSAHLEVVESRIAGNQGFGIYAYESAQVSVISTSIANNLFVGIYAKDMATVRVHSSEISSQFDGLIILDLTNLHIIESTVAENRERGLVLGGLATAWVRQSRIVNNGTWAFCQEIDHICPGITVALRSQLALVDSIIQGNTDWGLVASLKKCGYSEDSFTGMVTVDEKTVIEGNNTSGNQNGMGNPGNHPWNRPDVPDGQVCLP